MNITYGGEYMKHYTSEELDIKIHGFLHKKFDKYPELSSDHHREDASHKQNLKTRLIDSLTNNIVLLSH